MTYSGQALIHDPLFDRDCECVFGSLEVADAELAVMSYRIAHNIAIGAQLTPGLMGYVVTCQHPCVLIVEYIGNEILLRACVAVRVHEAAPAILQKSPAGLVSS
jgi:hypothetical protein